METMLATVRMIAYADQGERLAACHRTIARLRIGNEKLRSWRSGEHELIRRLAVELEAMNARHGCGQIECSIAMDAVAEARRVLGLRRNEPFPIGSDA